MRQRDLVVVGARVGVEVGDHHARRNEARVEIDVGIGDVLALDARQPDDFAQTEARLKLSLDVGLAPAGVAVFVDPAAFGHDCGAVAIDFDAAALGIRRLGQYQKPNQLVLNTTPAFARHWLLPRLADFRQQHPHVDLWIFSTDEVPDMASQTIDLAVRDDISSQAECSFKVLHTDRLYPACHPSVLAQPAVQRATLHGEREMDWSHWAVEAGIDVGQQDQGLNFSDPGLLMDAACAGLGIALVSQLLSRQARDNGLLQPLVEQTIRGPNWALLTHRDSETNAQQLIEWLTCNLEAENPAYSKTSTHE